MGPGPEEEGSRKSEQIKAMELILGPESMVSIHRISGEQISHVKPVQDITCGECDPLPGIIMCELVHKVLFELQSPASFNVLGVHPYYKDAVESTALHVHIF